MSDNMSYTTSAQYHLAAPHPQYYPSPHAAHGHPHVANPPPRTDNNQRKRPKYTRSKTGCMTCRVKKIKCDEAKPNCMRCTHGQRDCTWPESAPTRKKSTVRKDSEEGRPSTAGSSGLSDGSTPPTREHTPSRRDSVDMGLMPLQSRRRLSDPYLAHTMSVEPEVRRVITDRTVPGYPPSTHSALTMIPETFSRYEYPHHSRTTGYRSMHHESVGQWNGQEYFAAQERTLVPHMGSDSHTRYQ